MFAMESNTDLLKFHLPEEQCPSQSKSSAMSKEAKTQVKVSVAIEALWKSLAKDFVTILPKVAPSFITKVDLIQGDGGLGSVFLFQFGLDVNIGSSYQKEKLVIFDESQHQFGLQVVEGGHLNQGFSLYTTVFKLTSVAEAETLVDVKVVYETDAEEAHMPGDTTKASVGFIKLLEGYLLKQDP